MRVSYSPYHLKLKNSLNFHNGMLLRFEIDEGIGYADCFPWSEFGDLNLEGQIQTIKENRFTPLLNQAFLFAKMDAHARSEKRSLFQSLNLVKSHALLSRTNIEMQINHFTSLGIQLVKLKIQPGDEQFVLQNTSLLKQYGMRWRLDANAQFTFDSMDKFLNSTVAIHSEIDLIEDPFPYDAKKWLDLEEQYGIAFACDFEKPSDFHNHILIHKPCTRALPNYPIKRIIVTSSLGHPLGQLMSAYIATTKAKDEIGGFLSHWAYEPTDFSRQLVVEKGSLIPPEGTGFGFDKQLEKLSWILIGNH